MAKIHCQYIKHLHQDNRACFKLGTKLYQVMFVHIKEQVQRYSFTNSRTFFILTQMFQSALSKEKNHSLVGRNGFAGIKEHEYPFTKGVVNYMMNFQWFSLRFFLNQSAGILLHVVFLPTTAGPSGAMLRMSFQLLYNYQVMHS